MFDARVMTSVVLGAAVAVGCGRQPPPAASVVATNVVTVTARVTNVVEETKTVVVTNVVTVRREKPRARTPRKTAAYLVSTKNLRGAQLRKVLSDAGARVVSCDPGAVAVVEAPDKVVGALRTGGVVNVHQLEAADKYPADLALGASPREVCVLPLSVIDVESVAAAVRELGGEVVRVVTAGSPAVVAKVSGRNVKVLAGRGDVRLIERGDK